MQKKTLLSGVKPTGRPHLGNYFGAMKQFVDLQDSHDSFIFIANYHAMTGKVTPAELRAHSLDMALDYLAIGIDPAKTTLFLQSDVPQVTELCWIFNCITTMPYLMRAHAFKASVAKNIEAKFPLAGVMTEKTLKGYVKLSNNKDPEDMLEGINIGTFDYPVLMAADILIPDADVVPVGRDQKQHVEYARDIAEKFNLTFGEVFKLPEAMILSDVETVPGIDGQKMSKSYGNTIPLFGSDEEIKKAVMSIVTDSASGVPTNVYNIHKLFRSKAELDALYEEKKGKYKDLKDALLADILAFVTPIRTRREMLAQNPDAVFEILKNGGQKARARAEAKMKMVREKTGLSF